MRYVPGLIPEKARVLPEYFKGNIYKTAKDNPVKLVFMWTGGIILILSALTYIKHPLLLVLFGWTGVIIIPPGHDWIERKWRFRFTGRIKAIFCTSLFLIALPLMIRYFRQDAELLVRQRLFDEKVAAAAKTAKQRKQQLQDSLEYYVRRGQQLANSHKIEDAEQWLQRAGMFAHTQADRSLISKEKDTYCDY